MKSTILRRGAMLGGFVLFSGTCVVSGTEIHRCVLEDGSVSFQETPCPEEKPEETQEAAEIDRASERHASDHDTDFVNPFDEPFAAVMPEASRPMSQDRSECEKMVRDAIDAIDDEMRAASYSKEQGQVYLAELLQLTRQLRECKEL